MDNTKIHTPTWYQNGVCMTNPAYLPMASECAIFHVAKSMDPKERPSRFTHAKLLEMPEENKEGVFDDCMKTQLVTSCRYYSNLLTKHLGRVKENLTKHLAQTIEENPQLCHVPAFTNTEVCIMNPSERTELACQALKYIPYSKLTRHISCCVLPPTVSLTDICKHDREHLKSVYYTLSAIEGRLRRLKSSSPNHY